MAYKWFEEGRLRERSQPERRNVGKRMQINRESSSRLLGGGLGKE
jgi:hypothetical protein